MLPILRNGVTALQGVDPDVLEAADGVGMTRRQRLTMVELPLGAPVILAGIRTAAVWTIGAATLATTVGQSSLGNLIFSGLQTENWVRVLVGCAAARAGAGGRRPARAWSSPVWRAARAGASAWASPGSRRRSASLSCRSRGRRARRDGRRSAPRTSRSNISWRASSRRRLQAAGFRTERRDNLGSTVAYEALAAGDIDVYVDYSGTLVDQHPPAPRHAAAGGDASGRWPRR